MWSPSRISGTRERDGLSRLELFIAIGAVGLLAVVSAPALQTAREASRRAQCQENLRRLGLALHSYHQIFASLPPLAYWSDTNIGVDVFMRPVTSPQTYGCIYAGWTHLILPYLGEDKLASQFQRDHPVIDERNRAARMTRLAVMNCPTDSLNTPANVFVLSDPSLPQDARFARGNYGINGGAQALDFSPGRLTFPIPDGSELISRSKAHGFQWYGNGVAGFNKCFSFRDFANGTSTLVMLEELRAGIVPEDDRGVWALGHIAASATWAHGLGGDDCGPNAQAEGADDILEGYQLVKKYGAALFRDARMPVCGHCGSNNQATARSMHPNGVNVLMADGSSRFIEDSIDQSLWHVLHSRETPADALRDIPETAWSPPSDEVIAATLPQQADRSPPGSIAPGANSNLPKTLTNSLGMKLTSVPPGEFVMALPDANFRGPLPKDEAASHRVRISRSFLLAVHEVTQREYEQIMGSNPSWHSPAGGGAELVAHREPARLPVENVTWYEATQFCQRLSAMEKEKSAGRRYRLPTEAEWEYACRCGSTEPYPFDPGWKPNQPPGEIAGKGPHPTEKILAPVPVGSYPPNAFGLCDMRGNVFEWCNDWFDKKYYLNSPTVDPQGPATGNLKVVRGWDWLFVGAACKDYSLMTPPWKKSRYVGFRVACDLVR